MPRWYGKWPTRYRWSITSHAPGDNGSLRLSIRGRALGTNWILGRLCSHFRFCESLIPRILRTCSKSSKSATLWLESRKCRCARDRTIVFSILLCWLVLLSRGICADSDCRRVLLERVLGTTDIALNSGFIVRQKPSTAFGATLVLNQVRLCIFICSVSFGKAIVIKLIFNAFIEFAMATRSKVTGE